PFRAAPERAAELRELLARERITLRWSPEPNAGLQTNAAERRIEFGLDFAERLWITASSCTRLAELVWGRGPGWASETDDVPEEIVRAFAVLSHGRGEDQPDSLQVQAKVPPPDPAEKRGAAGIAATELFVSAGGWLLLREIHPLVRGSGVGGYRD